MIGNRIRELRKSKGMSLREVARVAGISNSTLSDIENNKINPSIATLEKLSKALNIDIQLLFNNTEFKKEIDSFTIELVQQLLREGIIKDPNNIPQSIVDLIISALKTDIKKSLI